MSEEVIFRNIYENGVWNNKNPNIPLSGPGSLLDNTLGFRTLLDTFVKKANCKSVVDIGCGDLTWMPLTNTFNTCKYTGIDIVKQLIDSHSKKYPNKTFICGDASKCDIPYADIIIIRDVLFHVPIANIQTILNKIRCKFLFVTSCRDVSVNTDNFDQYRYRRIDITKSPFNLKNHIDSIFESNFNRDVLIFNWSKEIPKLIHQIWVGPNPIPTKSIDFMKHIQELHPDFTYRLWSDKDLTPDNFTTLPYIQKATSYAQKADIMRYEILYRYGGIYLDIDFQLLKPLDSLLTHPLVVCNEDSHINIRMTNAFIASSQFNPNMKKCVDNIEKAHINTGCIVTQTGPVYLRRCLIIDDSVRVLPTVCMYPVHYHHKHDIPNKTYTDDTFGVHHWNKNW
jgi:mannosyltransferase OCH1-like enzyme